MIFTVLQENNTIWREIWPWTRDSVNGKSKSMHYKNLAQKVLVSEPEFQPLISKNHRKAVTYFGTFIKNQMTQLEKRFKEAWENLGIISGGLLNKDTIWSKSEVRDK